MPNFEGLAFYTGRLLHRSEYKSGLSFAGERVLVVGFGNSGRAQDFDAIIMTTNQ